jgi:hypothetical protein
MRTNCCNTIWSCDRLSANSIRPHPSFFVISSPQIKSSIYQALLCSSLLAAPGTINEDHAFFSCFADGNFSYPVLPISFWKYLLSLATPLRILAESLFRVLQAPISFIPTICFCRFPKTYRHKAKLNCQLFIVYNYLMKSPQISYNGVID